MDGGHKPNTALDLKRHRKGQGKKPHVPTHFLKNHLTLQLKSHLLQRFSINVWSSLYESDSPCLNGRRFFAHAAGTAPFAAVPEWMAVVPVSHSVVDHEIPCNPLCRNSSCSFHPATQAKKLLEILKSMHTSEQIIISKNLKISINWNDIWFWEEHRTSTTFVGPAYQEPLFLPSYQDLLLASPWLYSQPSPVPPWPEGRHAQSQSWCFTTGDLMIKVPKEENIPPTMFQKISI